MAHERPRPRAADSGAAAVASALASGNRRSTLTARSAQPRSPSPSPTPSAADESAETAGFAGVTSPGERREDLLGHRPERPRNTINRSTGGGECEWYTPAEYIALAREVMGGIDLDPASCDIAQECVQARAYFTKEDNGLVQPWHGRVWLNPPYSQPTLRNFVTRLLREYDLGRVSEAVLLVNNCTETEWFHAAAAVSTAMCFPLGRIRFHRASHDPGTPAQGQTFFYFGKNAGRFTEVFGRLGIVTPMPEPTVVGRLL